MNSFELQVVVLWLDLSKQVLTRHLFRLRTVAAILSSVIVSEVQSHSPKFTEKTISMIFPDSQFRIFPMYLLDFAHHCLYRENLIRTGRYFRFLCPNPNKKTPKGLYLQN